jgi:hypothetical protein
MKKVDRVYYYPFRGVWYYTAWNESDFDHESQLEAEKDTEAREELEGMFPGVFLKQLWRDDVTRG